jgi:hypothetical protein
MFNNRYCEAITQLNMSCANSVCGSQVLCKMHRKNKYEECEICMDNMYIKERLACGHIFCKSCIYKWKGKECPKCRSTMFFQIHQKHILLKKANIYITKFDDQMLNDNVNIDELFEGITFLLQNSWIYVYDKSYKQIIIEYMNYGLTKNKLRFSRKNNSMKSMIKNITKDIK